MLCLTVARNVPMKRKMIFPQEHLQRVSESGETSWTFVKVPRNKGLRVDHSLNFCSFAIFNKTGKRKKLQLFITKIWKLCFVAA